MTIGSLVARLERWLADNESRLDGLGIRVHHVRFQEAEGEYGRCASVALENGKWGVQTDVWDAPILRVSVSITEISSVRVWFCDTPPRDSDSVDRLLDIAVKGMGTDDWGVLGPTYESQVYHEEDPLNV